MRSAMMAVWILLALSGCGGSFRDGCEDEIEALVRERGQPDEVQKHESDGYHIHTYWYRKLGFSRTFIWSAEVGGCKTSDQTFPPL